MARFHPRSDFVQVRAEMRSNELTGKPMPRTSPSDIRNANARREIERRRMERESREQ
ncbi:hypothetical protein PQU96_12895 [Vogesella sp. LYT5W]|uniref:Uncharacterized protein n=1 Tax=Vogesella margarita TaxID=2984199 RepID=A0ABT5IS42_9NEIS|nr:hypothetical protein [Vogesella margarita]MDC7715011.1 hypothetical protein [Vogesella margarita]